MPLTNYGELQMVQMPFGKSGSQTVNPTTFSVGLITVNQVWTPSTVISSAAVSAGYYCVGTKFNTTNGTPVRAIFKCTTAGTTNTAAQGEPAWAVTAGATTTEASGVTWQECTNQFFLTSGTSPYAFSGLEPVVGTNGYARATVTNTQSGSTWTTPTLATGTAAAGTTATYQSAISFGPSSGTGWQASGTTNGGTGWIVGYVLFDGSGNAWAWGLLNSYISVLSSGITVNVAANQLSVNLA